MRATVLRPAIENAQGLLPGRNVRGLRGAVLRQPIGKGLYRWPNIDSFYYWSSDDGLLATTAFIGADQWILHYKMTGRPLNICGTSHSAANYVNGVCRYAGMTYTLASDGSLDKYNGKGDLLTSINIGVANCVLSNQVGATLLLLAAQTGGTSVYFIDPSTLNTTATLSLSLDGYTLIGSPCEDSDGNIYVQVSETYATGHLRKFTNGGVQLAISELDLGFQGNVSLHHTTMHAETDNHPILVNFPTLTISGFSADLSTRRVIYHAATPASNAIEAWTDIPNNQLWAMSIREVAPYVYEKGLREILTNIFVVLRSRGAEERWP